MKKFFDFLNRNSKKILLPLVILVVVSTLGLLGYAYYVDKQDADVYSNVLAKVGSDVITQNDLNREIYSIDFDGSIEKPSKISDQEKKKLLEELITAKLIKNEADNLRITVSTEELNAEIASRAKDINGYDSEQQKIIREHAERAILKTKVEDAVLRVRTGEYLLFRFDKYIDYKDGETAITGTGDQALINQQRTYAKNLSEQVGAKLANGTMTFEQAIATVVSDPQISSKAFMPVRANFFGDFTKEDFLKKSSYFNEASYKGFTENVVKYKVGETSQPFILQANIEKSYQDIAFAIVKIGSAGQGKWDSYESWLKDKEKAIGVTRYVNNIAYKLNLSLIPEAKAAVGDTCSYAGSHRTNIVINIQYVTASGDKRNLNDVSVELTGADSLLVYNGACEKIDTITNVSRRTGGYDVYSNGFVNYGRVVTVNGNNRAILYNCNVNSAARITLPRGEGINSKISGNFSGGSWTWPDREWAATGGWHPESSSTSALADLDLGKTGSWANGTEVNEGFVYHPNWQQKLTLSKTGNGLGKAVATWKDKNDNNTSGTLNCTVNASCPAVSFDIPQGRTVTLTATTSTGSKFNGWSQDKNTAANPTTVSMSADKNVVVDFSLNDTNTGNPATSCDFKPQKGLSPMVIKLVAGVSNRGLGTAAVKPPFNVYFSFEPTKAYLIGSGDYTNDIYYTFGSAGTYDIKYKITGLNTSNATTIITDWKDCGTGKAYVTVPQSSSGGEVSP